MRDLISQAVARACVDRVCGLRCRGHGRTASGEQAQDTLAGRVVLV
jgi:hypothetical protein